MEDLFYKKCIQAGIEFVERSHWYSNLCESLGFSDEIVDFSTKFVDLVDKQISETDKSNPTKKVYTEVNTGLHLSFFSKFSFSFALIQEDELEEPYYDGKFNDNLSTINFNKDLMIKDIVPVMNLTIHVRFHQEFREVVYYAIGHELSHGYTEFCTLRNRFNRMVLKGDEEAIKFINERRKRKAVISDFILFLKDRIDKNYYNATLTMSNKFAPPTNRDVARFYYILSKQERGAIIQELRHELENVRFDITDSESATNAIFNSKVYKESVKVADKLYKSLYKASIDATESDKSMILTAINKNFSKKFVELDVAIKFCREQFYEFKDYFMHKAEKVAQAILDLNMATNKMEFRGKKYE